MDKLILADIQALAASDDYGGGGFLESASTVLGLSAALFLSNLDLWQGASYKLTSGEIDDIEAMIAQLEDDLISAGEPLMVNRCKITAENDQTVPTGSWEQVTLDEVIYDPDSMFNAHPGADSIVVQSPGAHIITASIQFASNAVGRRQLAIYVYDVSETVEIPIGMAILYTPVSGAGNLVNLTVQDDPDEDDYYTVKVLQNSGGNLDLIVTDRTPVLSVVRA